MHKCQAIRETSTHIFPPRSPHLLPIALGVLFEHLRELPSTRDWELTRSTGGTWLLCAPDVGDGSIQGTVDGLENRLNLSWSDGLGNFGAHRKLSLLVIANDGVCCFRVGEVVVTAGKLTTFLHQVLFPHTGS